MNSDDKNIDEITDVCTKTVIKLGKNGKNGHKEEKSYLTRYKELMEGRRKLNGEGKRKSTEYAEINKTIGKMIKKIKKRIKK